MKPLKLFLSAIIITTLFILATSLFAAPVPDTGITKCYDNEKEILCPKEGEEFYGQDANYSIKPMSYTKLDDNGNDLPITATTWAMVRDNVTGLIWENKTDDGSIHDKYNKYTLPDAGSVFIAKLNSDKFGGYSDWRLPTMIELGLIVDFGVLFLEPTINTNYFNNTIKDLYWSSAYYSCGRYFYGGLAVDFDDGHTGPGYSGMYNLYDHYYVRAVRNEESNIESLNNVVVNGDGTVSDNSTGLMWQQKNLEPYMSWKNALEYCEELALGGYTDWRLPTIKELKSISNYIYDKGNIIGTNAESTSSCNSTVPFFYWSSSTLGADAFYFSFAGGFEGVVNKNDSEYDIYVRAVRNIQSKTPPSEVVVVSPKTEEEIAKCPVVFKDDTFTLNFPAYSSPVDIYFVILNPDRKLIFVGLNGKLTLEYEPYTTGSKSAVNKSFSVAADSLFTEIAGKSVLYWLVAPANGGNILKSIESGRYELGWYNTYATKNNMGIFAQRLEKVK